MDRPELIRSRAGHGGDIYSERSETWLDLSANINPRPLPMEVYQALPDILDEARVYPDIEYEDLHTALADYAGKLCQLKIQPDWIIPGNGAVEILDKAIATARQVLIIRPCFSEYELSCIRHNVPYETLDRAPDLSVELGEAFFGLLRRKLEAHSILGAESSVAPWAALDPLQSAAPTTPATTGAYDLVVICNPNNPDGKKYEKKAFDQFLTDCTILGIRVIVDETFGEYLEDADMLLPLVATHHNLLVVKALTKFFGLPGVRLGYGITQDRSWNNAISAGLTTWNVGAFAQGIARILLKNDEFIKTSRTDNKINRDLLKAGLEASRLIDKVYPSSASFLMVYSKVMPALILQLREQGILIRDLAPMPGLGTGYARIAVKTGESIDQLLSTLQKFETDLSCPD